MGVFMMVEYGMCFVKPISPQPSNNYLKELEQATGVSKVRALRKRDVRELRELRKRRDSKFTEGVDLDDFGMMNETMSDEPRTIQLEIPNQIFIPLSRMSSLFQNASQVRRARTNERSDSGQFSLEKLPSDLNFTSIGGYTDIKEELNQILDFIQYPDKYLEHGVRLVRGLLLEGLPGNGKTLIARCLAGEAKMNFVACSGAEFTEKYVGVGASRVRELFEFVRENQPCILFIDEIDALARRRSEEGEMSHSERDSTLNQLLVLMDGFRQNENILVIGATNRMDMLDRAILRPGRFDKVIHIPNPDGETRRAILEIHGERKPLNVSIEHLTRITNGFSGAQIENLLNEATLMAIRKGEMPVNLNHIEHMKERMIIGQTSNYKRNITDTTLRRIAIHEVGHLLLALQSQYYERPWKITVDSMNPKNSLGYTIFETEEIDEGFFLREYLQDKIKVLLGGRVAEEIVYGHSVSSGALSDLEKAFAVAKTMIMDYGMGKSIIYPYLSETYKKRIDEQIHHLIHQMYLETKDYIAKNENLMDIFVEHLLLKKTLLWDEIQDIYKTYQYYPNLYNSNEFEIRDE